MSIGYKLYLEGITIYRLSCEDIPMNPVQRIWYRILGYLLTALFQHSWDKYWSEGEDKK